VATAIKPDEFDCKREYPQGEKENYASRFQPNNHIEATNETEEISDKGNGRDGGLVARGSSEDGKTVGRKGTTPKC